MLTYLSKFVTAFLLFYFQAVKPTVPPPEKREKKDKPNNKTQQSGSGWFGGIWDKLALKPKNQMKLPDDKNPSVSILLINFINRYHWDLEAK